MLLKFIGRLALLAALFFGLYLVFPDLMGAAYQSLWNILGPLVILLLVAAALPLRRR